jgi:transglutaminase-like putative cysteine protease
MPYYDITHLTRYSYSEFVTASLMEVRMKPRSDGFQNCSDFKIKISPTARVLNYQDYLQNTIHFFDIPGPHHKLAINVESVVEVRPLPDLPDSLPASAWEHMTLDGFGHDGYDMLQPGKFTGSTELIEDFAREIAIGRRDDPLTVLREMNAAIYFSLDYEQGATKVDSPIDVALTNRKGVCQDFAHIMATLVRGLGIPCRYVSGYLFHRRDERSAADASHAWVEAWLPELGWVGFDPTNNQMCGDRHIRVCLGRDYADAAPTRGVFTGEAETTLEVSVTVTQLENLPVEQRPLLAYDLQNYENQRQLLQQQQQQQ